MRLAVAGSWDGLIGVGLSRMGALSAAGAGADGGSGDMDEEAMVGCIAKAPAEAAKSFHLVFTLT